MKRGRQKEVNTTDIVLTTQYIAHYTRNILVQNLAYFLSIAKSAAKSPDTGLIKIHKDIEAYVTEHGWM